MAARPINPAEPGLEWIRRLVDVIAVQREPHLEPQRVPGAETDGLYPVALARGHQGMPELFQPRRGSVELEPVLARITRA
jgi:hypothetical protein